MKSLLIALLGASFVFAQGMGSSGSIIGTLADPSGATIAGASVQVKNRVTGYDKTVKTEADGTFRRSSRFIRWMAILRRSPNFATWPINTVR